MGDGKTQGGRDFEGLTGKLATGLGQVYDKGLPVFGQDLNAGLGGRTTSALNDLWKGSHAPNNLDEATSFGNSLLRGNGLTSGQTGARNTLGGLGDRFGAMASGLPGRSAAELGYGELSGDYDTIADSLRGRTAAELGYGRIDQNTRAPSSAQLGFEKIGRTLENPSYGERAFKDIASKSLGRSLSEGELMATARGDYLGGSNPYLQDVLDNAAEDTTADFGAAFGSAGRFGGSGHAGSLSKSLATTRTEALNKNYETERDRQLQALGAIETQRQLGKDNQFRAVGAADTARRGNLNDRMSAIAEGDDARLAQLGVNMQAIGAGDAARRSNLADRLGAMDRSGAALGASDAARRSNLADRLGLLDREATAARDVFGMEQQGTTNRFGASDRAAGLADASLDAARTRLGVGQVQDANSQAELLAQNDLFRRKNDAGYDNLARILGLANSGLGQQAGVKQETPWWQTALGGVLGLGSILA